MSKPETRKQLAALSFSEKVRILEKLRDRSLAIAAAGLRRQHNLKPAEEQNSNRQFCTCLGWEPCGCGNQPPYHCMQCCRELTEEQVKAAQGRGWYGKKGN